MLFVTAILAIFLAVFPFGTIGQAEASNEHPALFSHACVAWYLSASRQIGLGWVLSGFCKNTTGPGIYTWDDSNLLDGCIGVDDKGFLIHSIGGYMSRKCSECNNNNGWQVYQAKWQQLPCSFMSNYPIGALPAPRNTTWYATVPTPRISLSHRTLTWVSALLFLIIASLTRIDLAIQTLFMAISSRGSAVCLHRLHRVRKRCETCTPSLPLVTLQFPLLRRPIPRSLSAVQLRYPARCPYPTAAQLQHPVQYPPTTAQHQYPLRFPSPTAVQLPCPVRRPPPVAVQASFPTAIHNFRSPAISRTLDLLFLESCGPNVLTTRAFRPTLLLTLVSASAFLKGSFSLKSSAFSTRLVSTACRTWTFRLLLCSAIAKTTPSSISPRPTMPPRYRLSPPFRSLMVS